METKILGCLKKVGWIGGGPRDDVEENLPLRSQDHQRGEKNIDVETKSHDGNDEYREQQIGRKGRKKLCQGLHAFGQHNEADDPGGPGTDTGVPRQVQ
jgi:hypothetical protein